MELSEIQKSPDKALRLIQQLTNTVEKRNAQIDQLQEELRLALHRKFGRSSEKIDPSQEELFEEDLPTDREPVKDGTITVSSHTKKKSGRKPLDPNIPREVITHDIPEEEKICGCELKKVDEVVSERLQVIPEQIYVSTSDTNMPVETAKVPVMKRSLSSALLRHQHPSYPIA